MQWTFRSSIAMKQMEKKRKVRDLLILNIMIVLVPNHNPNEDIKWTKTLNFRAAALLQYQELEL